MKASRLKTLVLVIWGTIILLIGMLGLWFLTSQGLPSASFNQSNPGAAALLTAPPAPAMPPSKTPLRSSGFFYLPSATARFATPIPVTPSATFSLPLPIVEYSASLPTNANPLTGLIPANPELLNRRPVSVKISSFPREMVRPVQSGLTKADVVYEYFIGDDHLTRFIAVFYSQDAERAGPVRSGRYFDEHIMRMYHASLVYGYADKRVEKYLEESDLKPLLFLERPNTCPPLCAVEGVNAEIRLFVDTAGVGALLTDNSRQSLRASFFAPLLYPPSLTAIDRIYTHYSIYSYNYWEFDPAQQIYKRFSDASNATSFTQGEVYAPHIDYLTGTQVTADNVIVLMVPHMFHNEFDRADLMIDISLNGSGEAYLFRDGRMFKATWVRDQVNQPIQLVDAKGKPIPMKTGVTFYQIIDPESTIKQYDTTIEFLFSVPPLTVTPTPSPWGYVTPTRTPKNKH